MRYYLLPILFFFAIAVGNPPGNAPRPQQRCYTLVNTTQFTVHIDFQYALPINDAILSLDMIPGGQFVDCFNPGASSSATVFGVMWEGTADCQLTSTLNMGFGNLASPPGMYRIQNQPRNCGGGGGGDGRPRREPPHHHELSDAECRTSVELPRGPAVYTLKSSLGDNVCIGYQTDDPSKVRLANCDQNQQRLFTLIKAPDGCYYVRNGEVAGPPSGRCLDSNSMRSNDQIFALACNGTKYQRWKTFKLSNGAYNLINKDSGQCLDRDSNNPRPGDEAHQVDCNGSEWQGWFLTFVRRQ